MDSRRVTASMEQMKLDEHGRSGGGGGGGPAFPIMEFPVEIRAYIYSKLSSREAFTSRLVCQQWKQEIDDHYAFEGHINTRVPNWRNILEFPLMTCVVDCLEDDQRIVVGTKSNFSISIISIPVLQLADFRHPRKLESLQLLGTTQISASMTFKLLTSDIMSRIRELSFPMKLLFDNKTTIGSLAGINFQSLQGLDLELHRTLCLSRGAVALREAFEQLLTNPTLRNLRRLKLDINLGTPRVQEVAQYLITILMCLRQQSNHFCSFILDFWGGGDAEAVVNELGTELRRRNMELDFSNVTTLRTVILSVHSEGYKGIWMDFLEKQRGLQKLNLYGISHPNILRVILPQNANTLEEVIISCSTDSTLWSDSLDCHIFKGCHLKRLSLILTKESTAVVTLTNVRDLPSSVVLDLKGSFKLCM